MCQTSLLAPRSLLSCGHSRIGSTGFDIPPPIRLFIGSVFLPSFLPQIVDRFYDRNQAEVSANPKPVLRLLGWLQMFSE